MSDSHETANSDKNTPQGSANSAIARFIKWVGSVFFAPDVPENGKEEWELTHNETTATIRRTFLMILAASIYCAITLAGSSDARLIHEGNIVELPVLSYKVDFNAFLLGAPVILIGLTLYLHIFIAQHRMHPPLKDKVVPMLGNFSDVFPKFVAWLLFYWLTPLVLALFTWKIYPVETTQTEGQIKPHLVMTVILALSLLYLQIRRCPRKRRYFSIPVLLISFYIISQAYWNELSNRHFDLRWVDLSDANLENMILSDADMGGAILKNAQLDRARLENADLREADLTKANLFLAFLNQARLHHATLVCANMESANFIKTKMDNTDLSYAQLELATFVSPELNGAKFTGANLSKSKMSGKPDLTRATLTNASLRNIDWKCVDLTETKFYGADMMDAKLYGRGDEKCTVNFTNAHLQRANLTNATVSGANFFVTNLHNAILDGITIDNSIFDSANLESASLRSAQITTSKFYSADFNDADLAGAIIGDSELKSAHFREADMTKSQIYGSSNLESAKFSKADLTKATWIDIYAAYTYFDEARMSGITLRKSDLSGAILENADLSYADLTEVNFNEASFKSATLTQANLSGADLKGALDLEQHQLDAACGSSTTLLPDGLLIKICPDDWESQARTATENMGQIKRKHSPQTQNMDTTDKHDPCSSIDIDPGPGDREIVPG